MDKFTPDDIYNTFLLLIAAAGVFVLYVNARNGAVALRKPKADMESQLSAGKRRLDAHDEEIEALKDGQRVLLKGVQALLEHELHNGNTGEMADASRDINTYLLNR